MSHHIYPAHDRPVATFAILLWMIILPFGAALHNLAVVIFVLGLSWTIYLDNRTMSRLPRVRRWYLPFGLACGVLGSISIATCLNDLGAAGSMMTKVILIGHEIIGYLFWLVGPSIFLVARPSWGRVNWLLLAKVATIMLVLTGVICLSQYFGEWRLVGTEFVSSDRRPRGLFSHPLSLAYLAALVWPFCLYWWWQLFGKSFRESLWVSLSLGSCGTIILLTQSRVVQVVSVVIVIISVLRYSRRWMRLALLLSILGIGTGLWFSDNMVSSKFKETLSAEGLDRFGSYPDDRFAFWHVHALMFAERPVLGHGFATDYNYRLPYYDQVGLSHFNKKYPAHNVFLQIGVNGGLVALCFFIAWLVVPLLSTRRLLPRHHPVRWLCADTLIMFSLISLTQNSFHDLYVRNGLTVLVLCLFAYLVDPLASSKSPTKLL